jgi:uncharacterized protein YfaS (alpha-2-macroglobulin family)
MSRTALFVARSPLIVALCLAACQPVPSQPSDPAKPEYGDDGLVRQIPDVAQTLLFPPELTDRHPRAPLELEDGGALPDAKGLGVRAPYLGEDGGFEFAGRTFRVVFDREVAHKRAPTLKRPVPAAAGVLTIDPPVAGKAQWTAANVLEFTAAGHFDPAQTYTVKVDGLVGKDGAAMPAPWSATFTAEIALEVAGKTISYLPKPGEQRVIAIHPSGNSKVGRFATLAVIFDQPVDLAAAERQIKLDDEGGERPFTLTHHRNKVFQGVKVDPKQVVIVKPVKALRPGESVTLNAWDFDQQAGEARSRELEIADRLAQTEVSCGYSYDNATCEWSAPVLRTGGRDLVISYNNALADRGPALKAGITVDPPVANLSVWVANGWEGDGSIRLSGDFQSSNRYTVTIPPLKDVYGAAIAEPFSFTVATLPQPASVAMPEGVLVLDEQSTREFKITTRNVARGELLFWAIADDDAEALTRARGQVDSRTLPAGQPDVVVPFTPAAQPDQLITTAVDLLRALKPGKNYLASVGIAATAFDAKQIEYPSWSAASRPPVVLVTPGDRRALAVHTHMLSDATVVQVARLGSGEPVVGATLTLDGKALAGRSTDANGVVSLPIGLDRARTALLRVDDGQGATAQVQLGQDSTRERTYFPSLASDALSRAGDRRAMIVTDRGIYRPGALVYAKASVRRKVADALKPLKSTPIKARLVGPMGDDIATLQAVTDDMGSAALSFTLAADAAVGRHQILIEEIGGAAVTEGDAALARASILVAEFEPPRFTVDVDAALDGARKLAAKVTGRYLFGAAMDGASVDWTLTREAAPLPSGAFTDGGLRFVAEQPWSWWDEEERPDARWSRSGSATLGGDGTLTLNQPLELGDSVTPQRFTLEADVADASYRHIAGRGSVVVHPYPRYVGVKVAAPWTNVGQPNKVELGVMDQEGRPVVGVAVGARLEHTQWSYTRRRDASGELRYEWTSRSELIDRCDATSAATPVDCTFTPPRGGDYKVVTELDGHSGGEATFWAWGYGGDDDSGDEATFPDRGRKIEITPDKQRYSPGEVAKLMVRSPYPQAIAILTLEQGGLLTHQSARLRGATHVFEAPIVAAHAPQLHAVVTILPVGAEGDQRVDWKIGGLRIPVTVPEARLGVAVRSDRPAYEPGEEAVITVEVKDGERPRAGAEIALAVVDEGILRLTNHHAPDPVKALRPGLPLRFEVSDTRGGLANLLRLTHTAGDGMGGEDTANARKNFVETALWRPDLRTDRDGRAEVKLALPDNLTTFRMMAVVLDEDGKGGHVESSFLVRKPVMMIPAVPRFALVGDHFEAAAIVHNNQDTPLHGRATIAGEERELAIAAQGHQRVAVAIAPDAPGPLALDFAVADEKGKVRDAAQITLPIDVPGLGERPHLDGAFVGRQVIDMRVPAGVRGGVGADDYVAIKVGQHLWPELGQRLEYLLGYPHGCVEQTTSGLLPLIAAREILPRIGFVRLSRDELDKRIRSGLDRLATMRTPSGGLGYWPGDASPNPYGTAYAIRALIGAREAGVDLPAGLLDGMAAYLEGQLFVVSEVEVQAAIAHSLAELGRLQMSALDALYDRKDRQGVFGLASLALAFSGFSGESERVTALLDELEAAFDGDGALTRDAKPEDFYYYGSPTRSKAQAAIALGRLRPGSNLGTRLVSQLAKLDERYTTQATAYSLLALAERLRGAPKDGVKVTATLDGKALEPAQQLGAGALEYRLPLSELSARRGELVLQAEGSASVAFMVSGDWRRDLDDVAGLTATSADQGPELYRVYTTPRGEPVDLDAVTPGQVLRVSLYAKLPVGKVEWGRMNYLALTDRLPAGFEPVQTDLWTVARAPDVTEAHPFYEHLRYGGSDVSHLELRDDRVHVYFDRLWGDRAIATYLVRASTPGTFTAPPAVGEFMYIGGSQSYSERGQITVK